MTVRASWIRLSSNTACVLFLFVHLWVAHVLRSALSLFRVSDKPLTNPLMAASYADIRGGVTLVRKRCMSVADGLVWRRSFGLSRVLTMVSY